MKKQNAVHVGKDIALIVVGFLALPAAILILQRLQLPFGFSQLWVMGEERNWLYMLMAGSGSTTASLFWQLDSRNPLSPWWYVAVRSFFLSNGATPAILQLTMGLFVGISSYLMLNSVTNGRERYFALCVGLLSSVLVVNGFVDSIHWPFLGALASTMLCIWSYSEFVNSGRTLYPFLCLSTLFWFVAISTYSLQIGAAGAVIVVSLNNCLRSNDRLKNLCGSFFDICYFAVFFYVFLLIWKTSSVISITDVRLNPTWWQFTQSVFEGFWHDDYSEFMTWTASINSFVVVVCAACFFALYAAILSILSPKDGVRGSARDAIACIGCAICIVAPTVYLESGSDLWTPGSRWKMLMQFSTPFLTCSIVTLVTLPVKNASYRRTAKTAMVAAFGALFAVLSLGFNHRQVFQAEGEQRFVHAFISQVHHDFGNASKDGQEYLFLDEGENAVPPSILAKKYIDTEDLSVKAIFRFVPLKPTALPIVFRNDVVEHATVLKDLTLPIQDVRVAKWDGSAITILTTVDAATFAGYDVEWRRSTPLTQSNPANTTTSLR